MIFAEMMVCDVFEGEFGEGEGVLLWGGLVN